VTVATLLADWNKHAEKIETRAKTITPKQVIMISIAALPFLLCFLIYFGWKIVWTALTWIWSACVEGWETARTFDDRRAAAKRGEPWAS
jgi:hypothetical protein